MLRTCVPTDFSLYLHPQLDEDPGMQDVRKAGPDQAPGQEQRGGLGNGTGPKKHRCTSSAAFPISLTSVLFVPMALTLACVSGGA